MLKYLIREPRQAERDAPAPRRGFKSGPSAAYAASLAADAAKKQSIRPPRPAPKAYIYALVDPLTHWVRYVGQTTDVDARYRSHCSGKDKRTGEWIRSLQQPPALVILQTIEQKTARINGCQAAMVAETKWIKRFRRTVLNKNKRENSPSTWDRLVNSDEVRHKFL